MLSMLAALISQAQTTVQDGFEFEGINRVYRLYIPSSYNPSVAAPLLLNLHGYGSNMLEQESYGDFRPIADTAGFLVLHPNGSLDNTNTMHWNTFGTSEVDDVSFLSALIDTIAKKYTIDADRVYSTGMSNGGFMSHTLACALSGKIAAVAAVAGTLTNAGLANCMPLRPVPVMHVHGTADATVPYNGNFFFVSAPGIVSHWVEQNHCDENPETYTIPDSDPSDGCTAELYRYKNGDSGVEVELWKVNGGGHTWPGSAFNIGITNRDFSASTAIWQFLRKFDRGGLISTPEQWDSDLISLGPNPSEGHLRLSVKQGNLKEISVFNAMGQRSQTYFFAENQTEIFIADKGLHILRIATDKGVYTTKVMIRP